MSEDIAINEAEVSLANSCSCSKDVTSDEIILKKDEMLVKEDTLSKLSSNDDSLASVNEDGKLSDVATSNSGADVLPPLNKKLSAIENLRNLTFRLDEISRNQAYCSNSLPYI